LGNSFREQHTTKSGRIVQTKEAPKWFQFPGRFFPSSNIYSLIILLLAFILLESVLPLRTALKISADEDFEFAKVELCSKGYQLYTQIWDDQPPLYTFLLVQAAKIASGSVLGMRELNVLFSLLLIVGLYCLVLTTSGKNQSKERSAAGLGTWLAAFAAAVFLLASPGLLELSCSCMPEIPALAMVLITLCVLVSGRDLNKSRLTTAGFIFGVALQLKLISLIYSPLVLLVLWLRLGSKNSESVIRSLRLCTIYTCIFGACAMLSFVLLNALTGSPLVIQLQQAWTSHFSTGKSLEYGSAANHRFDWSIPFKAWETLIPALMGIGLLGLRLKENLRNKSAKDFLNDPPFCILPLSWLLLVLLVFVSHKPWWPYYYVHVAVPLSWLSGIGIAEAWNYLRRKRRMLPQVGFALFSLSALAWIGLRLYLQEVEIRSHPRTYSSYVLKKMVQYRPYTRFMFTDQPVYSLHADIPMPPQLAMLPLKRFWNGDMTNQRLATELEAAKPGIILLANDSRTVPYQDLLSREYQLVYVDPSNRLLVHKSIAKQGQHLSAP
jgi:hypothetical protein